MAPRLKDYPPEDLLAAPYLMEDFEPTMILELLARLTPDNALVELATPDFDSQTIEPWFGVPFDLVQGPLIIEPPTTTDLTLPNPNPFLPQDLAAARR